MAGVRTIPLLESEQVTLDSSGGGFVELKPSLYGQSWNITLIAVRVEPRPVTLEPECSVFQDGRFIGGSYSGSLDSDSSVNLTLQTSQGIQAVWTGGDVGKTAILTIQGTQTITGG